MKTVAQILGGLIGAGIAIYSAIAAVSALCSMVPAGEYAQVIEIGIVFLSVWLFGGLAILLTMLLTFLGGAAGGFLVEVLAAIFAPKRSKRF